MQTRLDKLLSREFLLGLLPIIASTIAFGLGKLDAATWLQAVLGSQGLATGGLLLSKRSPDVKQPKK